MSENKQSEAQTTKKSTFGLGQVFGLVVIGGIAYSILTAEPEENPYGGEQNAEVTAVKEIKSDVTRELISEGHFARTLPDGLHIIHDKNEDAYYLVMKAQYDSFDEGYGFFGMDELEHSYVPDAAPSSESAAFSLWSIAEAKDLLPLNLVAGRYGYTIGGNALNGTDLRFSIIYDADSGFDRGYGYMGLNVEQSKSVQPAYEPSFN
tara:strand:- start:186817 stop:187434 length:618 start_codon:yes stop_codon:yes gene_type:complete